MKNNPKSNLNPMDLTTTNSNQQKQKNLKRNIVAIIISLVISSSIFAFGLFWQNDTSLMAIGDSLWLVFALELMFAWTMFVYNYNIFSPLIHGTKTFFLLFMGRKPKDDYYTYFRKVEENQIPSFYIKVAFLSTLSVFIPALILMFILMN